jgi:hypothetical protein
MRLPPPRPVLWPLRPAESADVSEQRRAGQTVLTIQLAPLRGITPEMLPGWLVESARARLDGVCRRDLSPLRRVASARPHLVRRRRADDTDDDAPTVAAGTRLHMVEALGRDPAAVLDLHVRVRHLDGQSAVVERKVVGTSVVRLENELAASPRGAQYVTRMTLGDPTPPARLHLNRVAHAKALPPWKREKWIRHHIEEIGNLVNFLPDLFRSRADLEP